MGDKRTGKSSSRGVKKPGQSKVDTYVNTSELSEAYEERVAEFPRYKKLAGAEQEESDKGAKQNKARKRVFLNGRIPSIPPDKTIDTWDSHLSKQFNKQSAHTYHDGWTKLIRFSYRFNDFHCLLNIHIGPTASTEVFSIDSNEIIEGFAELMSMALLRCYNDIAKTDDHTAESTFSTRDSSRWPYLSYRISYDLALHCETRETLPHFKRLPPIPYKKFHRRIAEDAWGAIIQFFVANALHARHAEDVTADAALVTRILDEWRSDTSLSNDTMLTQSVQKKLAKQAAVIAKQTLAAQTSDQSLQSDKVVDPVSGLELPLPLRKSYQERGRHEDGKRLNVFEHLRAVYPDYFEAGLMFSGLIRDVDRTAYQALLNLAKKHVDETEDRADKSEAVADYLLSQGILTATHLSKTIPKGFEAQVSLLKRLHKQRIATGLSK